MSFLSASFTPAAHAPLAQSPAFAAALSRVGTAPLRIGLRYGAGEVSVIRRAFGPLRVGLISRMDVSRRDLKHLARKADAAVLLLNPESELGAHGLPLQTPASVAELDLSHGLDTLRMGLKQKWRNRLHKAERMSIQVVEKALHPDRDHWLFDMEAQQSRARGYLNWSEGLTRAFAKANPGQARVFEARSAGCVLAAMLFLTHGSVATYHMGWTSAQGRSFCAHHLILWHAIQSLQSRGAERLDLGSVATDRAPGLARFKLGTGAYLRTLGGSWAIAPRLIRA